MALSFNNFNNSPHIPFARNESFKMGRVNNSNNNFLSKPKLESNTNKNPPGLESKNISNNSNRNSLEQKVSKSSINLLNICKNMNEQADFLIPFSKGGSSWQIYAIKDDPQTVMKYTNFYSYKSADLGRSKHRESQYISNIKAEIEINLLLKGKTFKNVLIPKDVGYCDEDGKPFYILYPRLGDNLETILMNKELHGYRDLIKTVFIDVIRGLIDLQSLSILHNDMEPRNILFNAVPGDNHFVISDYGVSKIKVLEGAKIFRDIAQLIAYFYYKNYPGSHALLSIFGITLDITHEPVSKALLKEYGTMDNLLKHIETNM